MNAYTYYYAVSMYFINSDRWEQLVSNEPIVADNSRRAIALLIILYVNDILNNAEDYKFYDERNIVIKWTVFRVPVTEDGVLQYDNKRHCYSIASDKRIKAKKYITINDILK